MKVIFTLDSLGIGGTEKSTLDIISRFSSDTEVKLVYFYPNHELKETYEKAGISLLYVPLRNKKSFLQGIIRFRKILKKEKPDLVVSSIAKADIISRVACYLTGVKVIGTFVNDTYGAISIQEQKDRKNYVKFLYYWILDSITGKANAYWISNCKSIAFTNAKALGVRKKRIKVIYRGRDVSRFSPWQPRKDRSPFRFLFIGRLIERKGLGELMKAFAIVRKTFPDTELHIIGKGNYENKIRYYVEEFGLADAVVLHGAVVNGFSRLYEADCFVFPSWYEGFSGSLVEAMLAGIPIIASDIEMNKEAVTDQKTALLFPVKDHLLLAENMKRMIREYDDMINLGKFAREEAMGRFDINIISKQYESFLQSVVDHNTDYSLLI
jgi:glycosyltransferase involved in cell wall biosynthesis